MDGTVVRVVDGDDRPVLGADVVLNWFGRVGQTHHVRLRPEGCCDARGASGAVLHAHGERRFIHAIDDDGVVWGQVRLNLPRLDEVERLDFRGLHGKGGAHTNVFWGSSGDGQPVVEPVCDAVRALPVDVVLKIGEVGLEEGNDACHDGHHHGEQHDDAEDFADRLLVSERTVRASGAGVHGQRTAASVYEPSRCRLGVRWPSASLSTAAASPRKMLNSGPS